MFFRGKVQEKKELILFSWAKEEEEENIFYEESVVFKDKSLSQSRLNISQTKLARGR